MSTRFLLWALSLQSGVNALRRHDDGTAEDPESAVQKFLVELAPILTSYEGNDIDGLKNQVEQLPGVVVLKTFESDIFTGLSIDTSHATSDTPLDSLRAATHAWPLRTIKRANLPDADHVFDDDVSAKNYSLHHYTGVDKAHAVGYFGKGAVIAVVDTGIDYKHPALGGGIGPGFKIAGGYDFVGDEDFPIGPKDPDEDPMDQRGHGTHVAGIIAGKTDAFVGVAPEATLLAYKVFTSLDGTDEETLIDSFLMAYEAGADIITASIGGPYGWADGGWAMVASRIVDQGIIVTIAASNDGWVGPFFASSGSSGKNVIAVASMEPSTLAAEPFIFNVTREGQPKLLTLGYIPGESSWEVLDRTIIPTSSNSTIADDACQPLPSDFPDLSNAIALIRRGGCDFIVKQANAEKAGAKFVLFYNDDRQILSPYSPSTVSQIAMIEAEAGKVIIDAINASGTASASFTHKSNRVGIHNAAGGRPNAFTSWGGLYDLQIKPDVAAPGGHIYSTEMNESWGVRSGTSMAAPYVAGIAALYIGRYGGRSAHGKSFGRDMFKRIVTSGAALPWSISDIPPVRDYGYFAPVPQIGTGMIDATKVLNYTTVLEYENFGLNDTANFLPQHDLTITNNGLEDVTYEFAVQPAGGFEMYESRWPQNVREGEMPIYSGKILVSGSNHEALSVPYFGAAFSLLEQMPQQFSDGSPSINTGGNSFE
ncbi:hypothetical protein ACHAQA_006614 [Verticillium albo-atrum]